MVHMLAKQDPRVVFVGSDLGPETLRGMREEFPDRFFMEGVSEQAIIGMAAGLAMEGYIPYVNTIATFITRRCYEQVALDLCLHKQKVRLIANGGGVVYAPLGPTHLAIEDLAIMRALPHMTVIAPVDAAEMERLMPLTLDIEGPVYIRLAKGGDPVVSKIEHGVAIGKGILHREPGRVLICSTGIMTTRALQAADALAQIGIRAGVLHLHTVKPLDAEQIKSLVGNVELLVTAEEHVLTGGLGSAIVETLVDDPATRMPRMLRLGLPDRFAEDYGSQDSLLAGYGLSPAGIAKSVENALQQ